MPKLSFPGNISPLEVLLRQANLFLPKSFIPIFVMRLLAKSAGNFLITAV